MIAETGYSLTGIEIAQYNKTLKIRFQSKSHFKIEKGGNL